MRPGAVWCLRVLGFRLFWALKFGVFGVVWFWGLELQAIWGKGLGLSRFRGLAFGANKSQHSIAQTLKP